MLKSCCYFFTMLSILSGCIKSGEINVDDLNSEKQNFFRTVFESEKKEGPFFLNYSSTTVFLSEDIISIFGEFTKYTHFPHDRKRFEGKTFCKTNGKFKLVTFDDLFTTAEQKEFIRNYCEKTLKEHSIGYYGLTPSPRDKLELHEIQTFLIHENFLVILFQRYSVAGLEDYPTTLKIPYAVLHDHLNPNNSLIPLLEKTVTSQTFTSSWDNVWGEDTLASYVGSS